MNYSQRVFKRLFEYNEGNCSTCHEVIECIRSHCLLVIGLTQTGGAPAFGGRVNKRGFCTRFPGQLAFKTLYTIFPDAHAVFTNKTQNTDKINRMMRVIMWFLGATKRLYNWLCPLVCRSVGLSGNAFVRRSTRRTLLAYLALLQLRWYFIIFDKISSNFYGWHLF